MIREHIDEENLRVNEIPTKRDSLMPVEGGVTVVVTQAFGPTGANLVGLSDVQFDGFPAVTLLVRRPDGKEGLVHLSPIHGDKRKVGFTEIEPGTKVELLCPVSRKPLDRLGPVEDGSGAEYRALYLTPDLDPAVCVMITDVWDHYHSRIVDGNAVVSYWSRIHVSEESQPPSSNAQTPSNER
ncbi:MAG: hypothetical protein RMJ84_05345 [Sandaracinaceae bacterium]|nr:hypothetical protein [Sandaracinaceae bacterium]